MSSVFNKSLLQQVKCWKNKPLGKSCRRKMSELFHMPSTLLQHFNILLEASSTIVGIPVLVTSIFRWKPLIISTPRLKRCDVSPNMFPETAWCGPSTVYLVHSTYEDCLRHGRVKHGAKHETAPEGESRWQKRGHQRKTDVIGTLLYLQYGLNSVVN